MRSGLEFSADTFYVLMGVAASLRISPGSERKFPSLSADGAKVAQELVRLSRGEVLGNSLHEQAARYFMGLI